MFYKRVFNETKKANKVVEFMNLEREDMNIT